MTETKVRKTKKLNFKKQRNKSKQKIPKITRKRNKIKLKEIK